MDERAVSGLSSPLVPERGVAAPMRTVRLEIPLSHAADIGSFLPEDLRRSPEIVQAIEAERVRPGSVLVRPVSFTRTGPRAPSPQAIVETPHKSGDWNQSSLGKNYGRAPLPWGPIISIVITAASTVMLITFLLL